MITPSSLLRFLPAPVLLAVLGTASATPVVGFYTNRAVFESALTSKSTIDFEVPEVTAPNDGGYSFLGSSAVFEDVTFSGSGGNPLLVLCGKSCPLGSFNSALLFADGGTPISADLTTAGSGFTAVGGTFGDIIWGYPTVTITVAGASGVLDVRTLQSEHFRLGDAESFFGWIVQGDSITGLQINAEGVDAIDNFVFGVAGANLPPDGPPDGEGGTGGGDAPEPATLALVVAGLLGAAASRRRKTTTVTC